MAQRVKTFDSSGTPPNGVLYASDLNAIQDNYAQLSDLAQSVDVGSIDFGEVGLTVQKYAAGVLQVVGDLRVNDITVVNGIDGSQLQAGTVGETELEAGAVTNTILGPDAVNGAKIADNSIGNEHMLNNAINTNEIVNDAVTNDKIGLLAVGTTEIANEAVTTGKIALDAVDGTRIPDNAIGSEHIQASAVGSSEIADGQVGAAEIAGLAISNSHISNTAAIAKAKLGALNIVDADVSAISGSKITAETITNVQIDDGTVRTNEIANGTILDGDISASAGIQGSKLAAATIPAGKYAADSIRTADILDGEITLPKLTEVGAAAGDVIQYEAGSWAMRPKCPVYTNVSSLDPSPIDGDQAIIDVGTNALVLLRYSATRGWVGEVHHAFPTNDTMTTTSGAYVQQPQSTFTISDGKAYYDAGLRLAVSAFFRQWTSNGSFVCACVMQMYEPFENSTSAQGGRLGNAVGYKETNSNAAVLKFQSWQNFTTVPAQANIAVGIENKNNGGSVTVSFDRPQYSYCWYAP